MPRLATPLLLTVYGQDANMKSIVYIYILFIMFLFFPWGVGFGMCLFDICVFFGCVFHFRTAQTWYNLQAIGATVELSASGCESFVRQPRSKRSADSTAMSGLCKMESGGRG